MASPDLKLASPGCRTCELDRPVPACVFELCGFLMGGA